MEEVSPKRQFETTETFNVGSMKDDFGVKDIKEIDEKELQTFLLGEPVPEVEDDEKLTKLNGLEEKQDDPDDIPSVRKKETKKEEKPKEEVDRYLNDKKEDKSKEQTGDEEESIFTTLNRDLVKNGIFTDEEDVQDAVQFKEKFVKEMHKGVDNILEQFLSHHGPEYRDAFQAIFVDGVSPDKYFQHVERIDNLQDMDLKVVDNQERVLRAYYKSKKFTEEQINKKIDRLKDYGDLEDEATTVHGIMVDEESEKLEVERERAQERAHRIEQNRQNYRRAIDKILSEKVKAKNFDGIPIDPVLASRAFKSLTEGAWKLPDGRVITDFDKRILDLDQPENFEKKLKLQLLLENDLDLSIIKKEAIKNENNEIFDGLQRKKAKKEIPSANNMKSFF